MNRAVTHCPGSSIEEKTTAVVWHYRNAESSHGAETAKKLVNNLSRSLKNSKYFQIVEGNHIVEVRPANIDKGVVAKALLIGQTTGFILAIGDDRTDEDLFAALSRNSFTIKVGAGKSKARYHLHDPMAVIRLLEDLLSTDRQNFR